MSARKAGGKKRSRYTKKANTAFEHGVHADGELSNKERKRRNRVNMKVAKAKANSGKGKFRVRHSDASNNWMQRLGY